MTGTKLGNYEILDKLGEGGMGEVWRARDSRLQRFVAIKILPPDVAGDPSRRARFEQEARALGALNHPNIVTIFDVGEADGRAYLVSELVEGESLRIILDRGPIPARKVAEIAVQIADGLAAAHSLGIVHRDLKPENVMITPAGQVKVLDFGLAKQNTAAESDRTATMALSQPGMVMGTAGYMSPEQVRADPVDARSDIFSFGCVVYEMIARRRAFQAPTAVETLSAILNAEPPDLDDPVKFPPALAGIVRRCLEKRKEQRFQSAADLAFALRAIASASSTGPQMAMTAPVSAKQNRRWIWGALVPAAVMVLIVGPAVWFRPSTGTPHAEYQRITFRRGYVVTARFTPGGRGIVYEATWDGGPNRIYLATPGNADSRDLEMPERSFLTSVSSKEDVAFLHDGHLMLSTISGGQMRPLLDQVLTADWAPDGSSLAVLREVDGVARLEYPRNAQSGTVLVDKIPYPRGLIRISPDGERVAFATFGGGSRIELKVADRKGQVKSLGLVSGQNSTGEASALAWTPKGDEIWFRSFDVAEPGIVYAVNMNGTRRVALQLPASVKFWDLAADGRALLSAGSLQQGILGAAPGGEEHDISCLDSAQVRGISDDGGTIVANILGEGGGANGSIYIRKMDGSPAVRISDGHAFTMSPDAKWISGYMQDEKGSRRNMLIPTGAGEPIETRAPGLAATLVSGFLGEKKYLVLGAREGHGWQCFTWDARSGAVQPVSPEGIPDTLPILSPDRKSALSPGPKGGFFVYSLEGGPAREIPGIGPDEHPIGWRADGRTIFVIPNSQGATRIPIYVLDLATGKRSLWKELHPAQPVVELHDLRIAPNGAYAYSFVTGSSDLYVASGLK